MFDFLSQKFSSIFESITGKTTVTTETIDAVLGQVKEALLHADVTYSVVEDFCGLVKKELENKKNTSGLKPDEYITKVVYEQLAAFLGNGTSVPFAFQFPSVVLMMGLQGSGKTTTVGKLAHLVMQEARAKNKRRDVLVASVDFYRPAAVDQLEIVTKQAGATFYRAQGTDPVAAAQEIYHEYKKGKFELLFLDTAGRLHVDERMLQELQKISQLVAPRYKILVLDAMTGQESLRVAKTFDEHIGFNGAILTKMDSDARGGAAFAFRYALKKPIIFAGFGEKVEDLQKFHPDRIAQRMLNFGDISTFLEKAEEKIKKAEQDQVYNAFMSGSLTLEDFAKQMDMMSRLGSLTQLSQYIPGLGKSVTQDQLQAGEREMKKFRAIISSMTLQERRKSALVDDSRKKRIAAGAGVKEADVTALLQRFEEAKQYVKMFKKSGPFKGLYR